MGLAERTRIKIRTQKFFADFFKSRLLKIPEHGVLPCFAQQSVSVMSQARQKKQICHEPTVSCSLLVKSKPAAAGLR